MTSMKICFKCGQSKTLIEFYKRLETVDGHLNKCKVCTKNDAKASYRINIDKRKEYGRKRNAFPHRVRWQKHYQQTLVGKAARKMATARWRQKFPRKYLTYIITHNAIRDNRLNKRPCEICGETLVQAHHDNYSKPLDVLWFCVRHHREKHVHMREMNLKCA